MHQISNELLEEAQLARMSIMKVCDIPFSYKLL